MGNNLLSAYLNVLNIKHTKVYSEEYFSEHPYNNSLYGLSTMLDHYHIENKGIRIKDISIENIPQTPFITNIGNNFVIITEITDNKVKCIWNNKKINLSMDTFLEEWNGTALIAQANDLSIEPNYTENRKKEIYNKISKFLLYFLITLLLLFFYIDNNIYHNMKINILLILNLIGIYLSYLLISKELNGYNRSADYLCSVFKQGDCNNILISEDAKLLGLIGWAEIGFGYFLSNSILIISNPSWIQYLCIINIFALPYTFWSVWYQKYKIKTWCILCLFIQCILWSYFIVGLVFNYLTFSHFNFIEIGIIGCIFIFCIIITNMLYSLSQQANHKRLLTYKMNVLKTNENVFIALLKQQPYYPVSTEDSIIVFGNSNAKFRITIFSNPHCHPCKKMHNRIQVLLESRDDICIQYIFSSFNESLDISNKFLCSVYINKSINESYLIYDEWFNNYSATNQEIFEKYKLDLESDLVLKEFEKHNKWKKATGLTETPTILVNGYKLPTHYVLEDLVYLTKVNI